MTESQPFYIPANPGFSVIEPVTDENNSIVEAGLTPIVAWLIRHDTTSRRLDKPFAEIIPVTLEGLERDKDVVYPDGTVSSPFDRTYDSIGYWLKAQQDEQQEKNEKLARQVPDQKKHGDNNKD